ncbi:MAG: hypothetical protein ACLT1O_05655 [Bifidobacterium pseudocatenulatum]
MPAAVAFIALLVSDLLRTKPIYGELLSGTCARHADGNRKPCGQRHYGTAIGNGAIADGKRVRDVRWVLITACVAASEIVPRGDTRLRAGDYLWLFSGGGARGTTCDAAAVGCPA